MAFYHPHGDGAIYDALARMAQDFSLRYPLIDGHGNFGSPDPNDRPAASRYTEARLAPLAMQLLASIDEDTVDMQTTYDGSTTEPVVLPARFPNLLVNGGGGIAVGMATNIPPHNLREVIDATVHLLDHPDATVADLQQFVLAPDFPTGALILGRAGLSEVYETGRGSVRMRAVAEIVEGRAGAVSIVVSELPYQTSAEVIGQKIAEIVDERRVEGIRDVRNESSGDTVRLVVDLKRDANAQVVLNLLYKHTPMQTNFAVNLLALVDGVPRLLSLRDALRSLHRAPGRGHHPAFAVPARRGPQACAHRRRAAPRARHDRRDHHAHPRQRRRGGRARRAAARAVLVLGDPGRAHPRHGAAPPRAARGPEPARRVREAARPRSPSSRRSSPTTPSCARSSARSCSRCARSTATSAARGSRSIPGAIDTLDLIDDEELVVVVSHSGYVKTVAADAFRRQSRGGRGVAGAKLRDEDYVEHLLTTTAHAYLLFFSNRGRVYRLRAHEIPMKDRTARGIALVNLISLQPDERIEAIIDTRTYEDGAYLFFATRQGTVKKTRMGEYDSSLRSGLIALNLHDGDELVRVVQTSGDDDIVMVSRDGMSIRFSETDVRPMGRAAAGVRGMRLKNGEDGVVSCDVAREGAVMLFVSSSGHGKRTPLDDFHRQGRGGQGVRGMKLPDSRGEVVAAFTVSDDDEMLVFSSAGNIVRMSVNEISQQGRAATGVRVARLGDGESVVAVARVLETDVAESDRPTRRRLPRRVDRVTASTSPVERRRRRGRLTWPSRSRSTPSRC